MHFGHSNTKHIYGLDNIPLDPTSEEKDLGVYESDTFKFSSHISKIAARANSILGRIFVLLSIKKKKL